LGFPTGWSFNYTPPTLFWRNQPAIKLFSGAVAEEELEDFCEGSFFCSHILYFVIVLLYFIYFTCIILYQKPKKIESLVVVISLL
jgi:hypothetical protein